MIGFNSIRFGMEHAPGLFLPLMLIFAVDTARADETIDPSKSALQSNVWYDAEADQVIPLGVQTKTDDTENRSSRWLPRAKRVPPPPPQAAPATQPKSSWANWWANLSFGNIIAWGLLSLMLLLIVGMLVYAFSQTDLELQGDASARTRLRGAPDEQMLQRMQELPAELRHVAGNLRDETLRLMQLGLYSQAIVTLFGHQLLMLDRAHMLRLARGKTNGRYIREARSVDMTAGVYLRQTVEAFERCYFGAYELSQTEFERLWHDNLQLELLVQSRDEVAA